MIDNYTLYLFSGVVAQPIHNKDKVSIRKYSGDKIKSCQLLTQTFGTYE